MSKGNLFLGHARGRVGSVVFSRLNGRQIARSYAENVSNPQTDGQATQRGVFATVTAFASAFRDIVNHTFDGIKEGQDNVNEFVKRNIPILRNLTLENAAGVGITPKGESLLLPNEFMVSKGQGPTIRLTSYKLGSGIARDYIEGDGTTTADTIYGLSFKALQTAIPGLKGGSELTRIAVGVKIDDQGNIQTVPMKSRLVFVPNAESLNAPVLTDDGFIYSQFLDLEKSTDYYGNAIVPGDDITGFLHAVPNSSTTNKNDSFDIELFRSDPFRDDPSFILYSWALILTNYDGDKADTQVHSTSYMYVDVDAWDYDAAAAIDTYKKAAKVASANQSDYYTDQSTSDFAGESYTVNDLAYVNIFTPGLATKVVKAGQSNSYGPIAEGQMVRLEIIPSSVGGLRMGTFRVLDSQGVEWGSLTYVNGAYFWSGTMPSKNETLQLTGIVLNLTDYSTAPLAIKVNLTKVDA